MQMNCPVIAMPSEIFQSLSIKTNAGFALIQSIRWHSPMLFEKRFTLRTLLRERIAAARSAFDPQQAAATFIDQLKMKSFT